MDSTTQLDDNPNSIVRNIDARNTATAQGYRRNTNANMKDDSGENADRAGKDIGAQQDNDSPTHDTWC